MPVPPTTAALQVREPTAAPMKAYGNNATVACACGRVVMVRSLGDPGGGSFQCDCHRYLKGYPDKGQRITHILVWEVGNDSAVADYAVEVHHSLHQAP